MMQASWVRLWLQSKEEKMIEFFKTKYGPLIFSLLSGLAYFGIILGFIISEAGGKGILLGIFFFPAIVFGMAFILLKGIKQWLLEENYKKIKAVATAHIVLMVISVVSVIAMI